jgi:hypothetical protein
MVNDGAHFYRSIAADNRISNHDLECLWRVAASFDPSLKLKPSELTLLASKRVSPIAYGRFTLFQRMIRKLPSLFSKFPVQRRIGRFDLSDTSCMTNEIRFGFPRSKRARVRSREKVEFLSIPRLVDRWCGRVGVFGVTDLHYMGTRFDKRINTSALNEFNLLPRGTDGFESQDSLVMSTQGAVTDSHSDDHSGSNHSFIGTKLWLLWDTIEGFDHGLEDVEHNDVFGQAAFDMTTFLAMASSRWLLIGPSQTMFIPANLTHKVITLSPYIGLGSFHAALPGFVDLLIRWESLRPQWASKSTRADRCTAGFLARRAIRKLRALRDASEADRLRWGLPHLRKRLDYLEADTDSAIWGSAGQKSHLTSFVRAARRATTP